MLFLETRSGYTVNMNGIHVIEHLFRYLGIALLLSGMLAGCGHKPFQASSIGKSSVDMVMDLHTRESEMLLADLMEKLYRRNPDELHKHVGASIASRQRQLFHDHLTRLRFDELHGAEGIHAMNLAFHPHFQGDRVFALITGLTGMVRRSYGFQQEQFLWTQLDENKLYLSARNIEILAWKLKTQHQADGQPFLITLGNDGVIDNTSFDRLYGKLIANQDMAAKIVADRYNRNISMIIQNTATFVFIPI